MTCYLLAVLLCLVAVVFLYRIYRGSFSPSRWAGHNRVQDRHNPRGPMVAGLLAHYLRRGMPRDSVLRLLGPPQWEGLEQCGVHGPWPDSLRFNSRRLSVESLNRWVATSPRDTLLRYPIGWAFADPRMLAVRLDSRARVVSARVEEH
jgi:hypothetical protein